jgi:hypothetical protein
MPSSIRLAFCSREAILAVSVLGLCFAKSESLTHDSWITPITAAFTRWIFSVRALRELESVF